MNEPYSGAGTNRPGNTSGEPPRICRECGEMFVSVIALRAHRASAHGDTWYRCSECGHRVRGYAAMQRHRVQAHRMLNRHPRRK
jgi:DNA-directed RNA polymerase subunit RPC12/RpoP